ncbi:hypothetical protein BLNAU_24155 [Blattamonas nauphoetae]|uniref:Uncharacterized protein n=1 Tax=Blattamonas nauphoetae TaxID=2049346 RepID=A0ABQ9WN96_9EUKA|nr:hypothetical protein BLNAU_24155 [Blattamonas nauphoetae]
MNPLYGACRSTRVANFKGVCDVEVDLVVVAADFTINGMCPSLVLDWRGDRLAECCRFPHNGCLIVLSNEKQEESSLSKIVRVHFSVRKMGK